MKPFCQAWVPVPVQESFDRMLTIEKGYPQAERECAARLVSSVAMEKFYCHPWFARWNVSSEAHSTAWKIWLNQAMVAAAIDHSARRDALDEQRERIQRLSGLVNKAGALLAEVEEAEVAAPVSLPLEFSDLFSLMDAALANREIVDDGDRANYEVHSEPLMEDTGMNAETNAVEINEHADAVSAAISNMKMSPAKKDEMTVADATEDDGLPDG